MVSGSPVPFLIKNLAPTKETFIFIIGLLVSVSSVALITANFAGGFLADRIGRKNTIILGSGILIPTLFGYSVAPNVFWAITLYFVQMFSISLFQPAFTALVADMSMTSSRGKAFGWFNLFWVGSTIPAPFIGGFLADTLGLRFPFILATLISVVGLTTSFRLTETSRGTASKDQTFPNIEDERCPMPFREVILYFGATSLLSGLASGMILPLGKLYPIDQLNVTATQLGLILSLGSSLVTTLVQIPGGRLADKYGRKPVMLFSLLGAFFVVAVAYTNSLFQFILAIAGIFAFGNIAAPAYQAWQMELVPCSKRAPAAGLINALSGIGMFFGPFISIWLYQSPANVAIAFIASAVPWIVQIPPILKLKETKAVRT